MHVLKNEIKREFEFNTTWVYIAYYMCYSHYYIWYEKVIAYLITHGHKSYSTKFIRIFRIFVLIDQILKLCMSMHAREVMHKIRGRRGSK